MNEMRAESDRGRDGSGWVLAIVVVLVVAVLGVGGTMWGFTTARRAREMAEMSRAQAMEMQARASMESERAEAAAMKAEQEMLRARQAEQAAEAEREKADQVRQFLEKAITAADPAKDQGRDANVRDMLDEAARKLDAGEIKDDDAAASLHSTVGMTYMSLGVFEQAEKHLRLALELRKKVKGQESPEVAADMQNLANVLRMQGK